MQNDLWKTITQKSDDLTIYGLLTYVMLFTTINANKGLSSLSDFMKQILPYKSDGSNVASQLIFFVITLLLYSLFKTNKNGFKRLIKKLLPDNSTSSSGLFTNSGIIDTFLGIVSGIFSLFITFFKCYF